MKIPATLYLTDDFRQDFLRATTDKERLAACTFYVLTLDMSNYWTKVGTCEVEVTWLPDSTVREAEVQRVYDQIEKIQLEAALKRSKALQAFSTSLERLNLNLKATGVKLTPDDYEYLAEQCGFRLHRPTVVQESFSGSSLLPL